MKKAIQQLKKEIEQKYKELKQNSETYGDLEKEVKKFAREMNWNEGRIGSCIGTEMQELLKRDTEKIKMIALIESRTRQEDKLDDVKGITIDLSNES